MLLPESPFFHVAPRCLCNGGKHPIAYRSLRFGAENDAIFFYYGCLQYNIL